MARYRVKINLEDHDGDLFIYVAAANGMQAQNAVFDAYTSADMVVSELETIVVDRFPENAPVINAIS